MLFVYFHAGIVVNTLFIVTVIIILSYHKSFEIV